MKERWHDFARALAAIIAISLLLLGVPALLVGLVGSPLDGPWATWLEGVRYGQVDPQLLISALTIVVWGAWLQLLGAFAVEATAAARGVIAQRPALLTFMQPLAAHLVSAALLLSTTLVSRSVPALAAPAEATSTAHVEPDRDMAEDTTPRPQTTYTRYEVRRRDTLWGIAERELGDGHRWREIRALNVGRPQPGGAMLRPGSTMIDIGWTLLLPATDDDPDRARDSTANDVVIVERGDTLSGIAADSLGTADRWPALYRHNRGRVQPDGRRLRDPDLIYPGWRIDVDVDTGSGDRPRTRRDGDQERDDRADTDLHTDARPEGGGHFDQRASLPAAEAPQRRRDPAPADQPAARDHDGGDAADSEDSDQAWMWWAAGGLMSAGVLALLARQQRIWRRRRHIGDVLAGSNQPVPVHPSGTDELRVRAAVAVRAFAGAYDVMPTIAGVTVSPTGDIALLLEDAAPDDLPHGWMRDPKDARVAVVPAAVGVSELEERAAIASSAAAGLVTLGVGANTGQLVLLALDSCGGVALSGPTEVVEATMLAWALELATSEFAGALDVWLVGFAFAPDTTSGWERLHAVDSVPEAVAGIRRQAIGTDEDQALPHRGDDDWIPQVIVCAPSLAPTPVRHLLAFASTYSDAGVITVASDEATPGHWHVSVASDAVTVTSLQDPVVLRPVRRTSRGEFTDITGMVERAVATAAATHDADVVDDAEPSAAMLERLAPPATLLRVDEPLPPDLVTVRLLGPVAVDAPSGGSAPTGRSLEAVAYLACHREGVSPDRLIDALWDGQAVDRQRLAEVVSRARQGIGGADRLRRGTASRGYSVAESVVTDLDLMAWHVLRAQREPDEMYRHLDAALRLVSGRPFADVDWTWSLVEGLMSHAGALVVDVTATLATWHMERGDHLAGLRAVEHGQLAVPESETLGRLKMRAHFERGEMDALRDVMTELRRSADGDLGPNGDDRLHPATVRLYRKLTSTHMSATAR